VNLFVSQNTDSDAAMTNQAINDRLREAARSLGLAHIAVANNDIGKALSVLTEACLDIAAVCEALAESRRETCNEVEC
jgi:hypothetical protein